MIKKRDGILSKKKEMEYVTDDVNGVDYKIVELMLVHGSS